MSGENWFLPGGYERLAKRLPDDFPLRLSAGDVIRMLTPGGERWGPAAERLAEEEAIGRVPDRQLGMRPQTRHRV